MPQTNTPSIPVPDGTNTVQVLSAIRSILIALQNQAASTNAANPQPSTFNVTNVQIKAVTFTTASNDTVTVPVIVSLTLTNPTTGETWKYVAPAAATSGGSIGQSL